MHVDASNFAIGTAIRAILAQPREGNMDFPICYASRQLNSAEKNYTTTEKELLAVVYAFGKFRSYLIGSKVVVHTDHSALRYLFSKNNLRQD